MYTNLLQRTRRESSNYYYYTYILSLLHDSLHSLTTAPQKAPVNFHLFGPHRFNDSFLYKVCFRKAFKQTLRQCKNAKISITVVLGISTFDKLLLLPTPPLDVFFFATTLHSKDEQPVRTSPMTQV